MDSLFHFPNTETRTADVLKAMADRDLLKDGGIVAWRNRQPKRERDDSSAERSGANQPMACGTHKVPKDAPLLRRELT